MTRRPWIVPLALLLAGCGSREYLEETGAPPRPMPDDVKIVVIEIPLADIGTGESNGFPRDKVAAYDGQRLAGYAVANVGSDGKWCRVVIAKELTGAEREHVLAHEKRHCAGQKHELRGGKLVWLP
jgi:hypothetical protein